MKFRGIAGLLLFASWSWGAELPVLRAATYNIWGLPDPIIRDPERIDQIAREIPRLGADIVAVQEAFHDRSLALTELVELPFVAWGPPAQGVRQGAGLLLLTRHRITYADRIVFDTCWDTDCLARKGVLYARVRVPEIGEVDVFDTHLQAADAQWVRLKQIDQAIRFVRRYHSPSRPAIFLGDFNAAPDSPEYARIRSELSMRDAHREYIEGSPDADPVERDGFTDDPLRNTNLEGEGYAPQRIDYAWIRGAEQLDLRVAHSRLLFDRPWNATGAPLSDHFGVEVDLAFSSKEGG